MGTDRKRASSRKGKSPKRKEIVIDTQDVISRLKAGEPVEIEGLGTLVTRTTPPSVRRQANTVYAIPGGSFVILEPEGSYSKEFRPEPSMAAEPAAAGLLSMDAIYSRNTHSLLHALLDIFKIEQKVLAEKIFDITPNTLRTYSKTSDKELSPRLKELAIGVSDLYTKGIELFGTAEAFTRWLNGSQYGLGYKKPVDMINTLTGINQVMEELLRIEFGATA